MEFFYRQIHSYRILNPVKTWIEKQQNGSRDGYHNAED